MVKQTQKPKTLSKEPGVFQA